MRKHIVYNTGRIYNNRQFLDIFFEEQNTTELNFDDVPVHFHDDSRSISGIVNLCGLEMVSNNEIGKAVLREYDAGRYTLL